MGAATDRAERASSTQRSDAFASKATVGIVVVLGLLLVVGMFSATGSQRTGPAAVSLPADREAVSTPLAASEPAGLEIPSIGVRADSIMNLGLNEDRSLQVPGDAATIGWYQGGSSPGESGPAVFASHVNYGGVEGGFANLADVEIGDQVLVPLEDGITASFVVDNVETISKQTFPTARVYGPTFRPEIRLITCGGDFDSGVRSYEDNVIVYGHLVEAYRT